MIDGDYPSRRHAERGLGERDRPRELRDWAWVRQLTPAMARRTSASPGTVTRATLASRQTGLNACDGVLFLDVGARVVDRVLNPSPQGLSAGVALSLMIDEKPKSRANDFGSRSIPNAADCLLNKLIEFGREGYAHKKRIARLTTTAKRQVHILEVGGIGLFASAP